MKKIKQEILDSQSVGDKKEKYNNKHYSVNNGSLHVNVFNNAVNILFIAVFHICANLLKMVAMTTEMVPKNRFIINCRKLIFRLLMLKGMVIIIAPNQAAERLAIMSESTVRRAGSIRIINNVTVARFSVNEIFMEGAGQ